MQLRGRLCCALCYDELISHQIRQIDLSCTRGTQLLTYMIYTIHIRCSIGRLRYFIHILLFKLHHMNIFTCLKGKNIWNFPIIYYIGTYKSDSFLSGCTDVLLVWAQVTYPLGYSVLRAGVAQPSCQTFLVENWPFNRSALASSEHYASRASQRVDHENCFWGQNHL